MMAKIVNSLHLHIALVSLKPLKAPVQPVTYLLPHIHTLIAIEKLEVDVTLVSL